MGARVNQQSPMHQLAIMFPGWAMFFHWAADGAHSFFPLGYVFSFGAKWGPFLFAADHYIIIIIFFVPRRFSLDLTSHITIIFTFLPWSVLHHPG
jgi:hypothetical protein